VARISCGIFYLDLPVNIGSKAFMQRVKAFDNRVVKHNDPKKKGKKSVEIGSKGRGLQNDDV